MPRTRSFALSFVVALAGASACANFDKSVRDDVSARMASISAPLTQCYEAALARNRKLAGTVSVAFTAENKTGQFKEAKVVQGLGDPELDRCVIGHVETLKLEKPTDANQSVTYPIEFAAVE